jgi:hypothetical protein
METTAFYLEVRELTIGCVRSPYLTQIWFFDNNIVGRQFVCRQRSYPGASKKCPERQNLPTPQKADMMDRLPMGVIHDTGDSQERENFFRSIRIRRIAIASGNRRIPIPDMAGLEN